MFWSTAMILCIKCSGGNSRERWKMSAIPPWMMLLSLGLLGLLNGGGAWSTWLRGVFAVVGNGTSSNQFMMMMMTWRGWAVFAGVAQMVGERNVMMGLALAVALWVGRHGDICERGNGDGNANGNESATEKRKRRGWKEDGSFLFVRMCLKGTRSA